MKHATQSVTIKSKILLASVAALIATGCATPHVVDSVKTTDANLTCSQIEAEIRDADRFRTDAQKEKGMTGTNVAAVIFFWPAMIGTYSNANEAIAAADTRKVHLMGLYKDKKCDSVSAAKAAEENALATKSLAAKSAEINALSKESRADKALSTTENRLSDLKSMLDKGLITQSEYDEKRKAILASH